MRLDHTTQEESSKLDPSMSMDRGVTEGPPHMGSQIRVSLQMQNEETDCLSFQGKGKWSCMQWKKSTQIIHNQEPRVCKEGAGTWQAANRRLGFNFPKTEKCATVCGLL